MSDNLEITILRKQNTQLAARIDVYRRTNKELVSKNQGLSVWSTNMATVLSSLQAAFRVFTTNQESLYELIKPKGNKESQAIVAKCMSHFKHFNQILNNLTFKINQNQRSNQFTKQAKQGIQSLVSAYEMFFKQFLKSYFAHNQKYQNWLNQALKSSDLRDQYRDLFQKEKENKALIKQFNLYFQQLRGKFPAYQKQNQTLLLSDVIKKRNQEIEVLQEKNQRLSHRFRLMMDYNSNAVNQSLIENADYSCICGGVQIQYTKEKWQQMEKIRNQEKLTEQSGEKKMDSEERRVLENQIEELVKQNVDYLNRNQQLKIENTIEESIFKSYAYENLVRETQDLLKYCGVLQNNIRELQASIVQIQKTRMRELAYMREKYESEIVYASKPAPIIPIKPQDYGIIKLIQNAFVPVIAKIKENLVFEQEQLKIQKEIRQNNEKIKQDSENAYKKYEDYLRRADKVGDIEFKHESHKHLIRQVQGYLPKNQILQKFTQYIRGRQKKVQHCERTIRKLEKDLAAKVLNYNNLQKNFQINQSLFESMSIKNSKIEEGMKSLQDFIKKVYYQNIQNRNSIQREKSLIQMKYRSESDANMSHQQKIKLLEEKIKKYEQYPTVYEGYTKAHQASQEIMKSRMEKAEQEFYKTSEMLKIKEAKLREYQKSQKRYTEVNERLRSKLNAYLKTQAQNSLQNTDEEKMNYALLELQEFKEKYYCSCQKQRKIEVSLKTCPHVFCKMCVEDVNKIRSRACPICRIKFSKGDINYMRWT